MASDEELRNYLSGVGIALASTACSAIGLTCQKLTHKKLLAAKEAEQPVKGKRYFLQPLWLLGIFCMLAGAIMSFAVFNFLGQSRASAMASITIVWNGILASIFLGEQFTFWDAFVTSIIIGGASVAVAFGSVGASSQSKSDLAQVVAQLSRQMAWIAGIIIAVVWIVIYIIVRRITAKAAARTPTEVRLECYLRIFLGGVMTGVTGMLASSVVKAIGGAVRDDDPAAVLTAYPFYLMLLSLPVSLVLQLGFLNSALAQLDALEVVPPFQASVIIIGLLWGWCFTGDASGATPLSMGMFAAGCAISCVGVLLLSIKARMRKVMPCCFRSLRAAAKNMDDVQLKSESKVGLVDAEGPGSEDADNGPKSADLTDEPANASVTDQVSVVVDGIASASAETADRSTHSSKPVSEIGGPSPQLPAVARPSNQTPELRAARKATDPSPEFRGLHRASSVRQPGANVGRQSIFAELFAMPLELDGSEEDTGEAVDDSDNRVAGAGLNVEIRGPRPSNVKRARAGTVDRHNEVLSNNMQFMDSSFTLASSITHIFNDGLADKTSEARAPRDSLAPRMSIFGSKTQNKP